MATWQNMGDIATVAQLTGFDAVKLIGMIVQAANTARMHKKNCKQFAKHLKLIGNLLEQLKISELKRYPETREPLEQLEDALRRSYILVNSCQNRSYLYLLAMGWNIVYQFRRAQNEIDRYLKLIPLITLVDNTRIRERLEYIDRDQCEYTLDDDDMKVQTVIMNRETSERDSVLLKKTLSCSYPNLPFEEAVKKENEKLQLELQLSQANFDISQCEVIRHLLDVTESVAATTMNSPERSSKPVEHNYPNLNDERYVKSSETHRPSRNDSSVSSTHELINSTEHKYSDEWHSDLLGCCSEPLLCMKTCLFPCGTFSRIASFATNRHLSSGQACNEVMGYSLILSCCCYTCCVRRKLRKKLDIAGGIVDDFLSHLMCCCCALVQEWREVEIRSPHGSPMYWDTLMFNLALGQIKPLRSVVKRIELFSIFKLGLLKLFYVIKLCSNRLSSSFH